MAQEPVHRLGVVAGSVGGDDRLECGDDLFGAGDAAGGGFEQGHRTDALGGIHRQLQGDERAVGVADDVGRGPADVIHQAGADRGVLGDREGAEPAAGGLTEAPSVAQGRELRELLDQRVVPRDEGSGVHEHDALTAVVEVVHQLYVVEHQVVHRSPSFRVFRSMITLVNSLIL